MDNNQETFETVTNTKPPTYVINNEIITRKQLTVVKVFRYHIDNGQIVRSLYSEHKYRSIVNIPADQFGTRIHN